MNWKGVFRAVWLVAKPVVPTLIQAGMTAAGLPMIGMFLNAAIAAQDGSDNGAGRFQLGMNSLSVAAPLIIDQLEKQLGVAIPDEAAAAYTKAQLQAHVDLLNAVGILPRKGA
jgi:acyl carrier protein